MQAMTRTDRTTEIVKISRTPFLRQLQITSGVWTSYFLLGVIIGAPTVFIPQIRREENSTKVISEEMASWITAAPVLGGFQWIFVITTCTRFIGRKITFIIATVDTFVAFIVFYCSTTVTEILISVIMQGLFVTSQVVLPVLILTEYTSPKYRGIFLTVKETMFYCGIWASNAIGTFFHWKNIALLGIICSVYILLSALIMPESPYWLASQCKFEACTASHSWLKGCDDEAKKELENIIASQREYFDNFNRSKQSIKKKVVNFFVTLTSREFYKPILISLLTGFFGILSGKLVYSLYAIDILKKFTENESVAYTGMLILDGVTVFSMYFSCIALNAIKRRTLLLVSGSIGITFLFLLSLYLYLVKISIIVENIYVSISLFIAFSIAVSCGPLIISFAIFAELVPVKSRNLAICIIAIIMKIMTGTFLKISPSIFKAFDVHGAFLFFGISSISCLSLLYRYLPETQNKTLQEIAFSVIGLKSVAESSELMLGNDLEVNINVRNR